MSYFPMWINLTDRDCLVIGGGSVAAGKVKTLLSFGARVTAVAPEFCSSFDEMAGNVIPDLRRAEGERTESVGEPSVQGVRFVRRQRAFEDTDLTGRCLVVAATDDICLNEQVAGLCRERGIPVNVVDQKELCTFLFSSVVKRDDLVIAVSTGGNSPALASALRREIEEMVPPAYGAVNARMGSVREYIQTQLSPRAASEVRKAAFQELLELLTGKQELRIGTRTSALALTQTELFATRLRERFPEIRVRVVPLKTSGDRLPDRPMGELGGKGAFIDVLEDALREGLIDCAVHSAKDMPAILPEDMRIACVLPREDPSDVIVAVRKMVAGYLPDTDSGMCREADGGQESGSDRDFLLPDAPLLPDSGDGGEAALRMAFRRWLESGVPVIGTGSARRQAQLQQLFPSCRVRGIRGNLPTRLEKLRRGDCDALVLAAAGLRRSGLDAQEDLCYYPVSVREMVPAGGQGTIVVEARGDRMIFLGVITDPDAALELEAERQILRRIGAGCHDAVGVYASREPQGGQICIDLWKKRNPEAGTTGIPEGGCGDGIPGTGTEALTVYRSVRRADVHDSMKLADEMAEDLMKWEDSSCRGEVCPS